ncbi:hypothetical protein GWK47_019421 [Chionoecetes opilio]|uniref:Reverse transcriptase domain-containing protein n=1 Tax=Chionoecetes opilio TaxID=41210 RepID=A0A8J4XS99_CHIOP|nr:hypothetical protein GWK47_019421 [Chionoecetes opilio]
MDWVLGRVVDQSDCEASLGNTKITDLVFADDAVIFAESLEVLVMALVALHEEAKPLGLEVFWLKTKVQVFGGLLNETVQSVHACDDENCGDVIVEHGISPGPKVSKHDLGHFMVSCLSSDENLHKLCGICNKQ